MTAFITRATASQAPQDHIGRLGQSGANLLCPNPGLEQGPSSCRVLLPRHGRQATNFTPSSRNLTGEQNAVSEGQAPLYNHHYRPCDS
jgi:hypothetical protein